VNRTLLACALAVGGASHAHAQSNVVFYGLIDEGLGYVKTDGSHGTASVDGGTSAGSRWGLRGTEALAGGVTLNLQLENGFDADTGRRSQNDRLFGRSAWASLAGDFGELRLGRQEALGFGWGIGISPFGPSFKQAQFDTVFGYRNVADRVDNAVFYYTPVWRGLQAGIGYSVNANGNETGSSDTPAVSLGARYDAGPLMLVMAYDEKRVADADTAANRNDVRNLTMGGSFDAGPFKVHVGYGRLRNRDFVATAASENAWLLGLTVPIGNGSLFGTYQRVGARNANEFGVDAPRHGVAAGYLHTLSPRTSLYAYASHYRNVARRPDASGDLAGSRQVGVGVRHRF
jgi:predicted porin